MNEVQILAARTIRWPLVCLLLSSSACGELFVDDASSDILCDSCSEIIISGVTTLRQADIRVEIGSVVVSTSADDRGRFAVAASAASDDDVVVITAVGDSNRGEAHLGLVSLVDTFGRLHDAANGSGIVDESRHGGLRVTVWSTARYAAIRAVADGIPASAADLDDAERRQGGALRSWTDELAYFWRFFNGTPLPAGVGSTLDLVHDVPLWLELSDAWFAIAEVESLDQAKAALTGDSSSFSGFSGESLSSYFTSLTTDIDGTVGGSINRWVFTSTGTGYRQYDARILPMTWIYDDEVLEVSHAPEVREIRLGTADILDLLETSTDTPDLLEALSESEYLIRVETIGARIERSLKGRNVHAAVTTDRLRYRFDLAFPTLSLSAVERDATGYVSLWHRDNFSIQPVSEAAVVGRWILPVADESNLDSLYGVGRGALIFASTEVELAADGTGRDFGAFGVGRDLTWSIDSQGRLVLEFAAGRRQTIAFVAEVGDAFGVISIYEASVPSLRIYGGAIPVGAKPAITAADLVADGNSFWMHRPVYRNNDGSVLGISLGGLRFDPDGRAYSIDDQGAFPLARTWSIVEEGIRIEDSVDNTGRSDCLPSRPDCFAWRRRVWTPHRLENGTLIVIRRQLFHREYDGLLGGAFSYDASRNGWFDSAGIELQQEDWVYAMTPVRRTLTLEPMP